MECPDILNMIFLGKHFHYVILLLKVLRVAHGTLLFEYLKNAETIF